MTSVAAAKPNLLVLLDALRPSLDRYFQSLESDKVTPGDLPSVLRKKLQLGGDELGPTSDGITSTAELIQIVESILNNSTKTASPRFLDKLFAGSDAIGQISELIIAILNTNTHVYSVSPVATLLEHEIIAAFSNLIGFPTLCSGVFLPGGSHSNLTAMTSARNLLYPEVKQKGIARSGIFLTAFTSIESHYSIDKSAIVLGLGLEGIVKIPTAGLGSGIDTLALKKSLQESFKKGETPYFVNLTAGTTVLSSWDDIEAACAAIKEVEQEFSVRIWVHVDGSYGGPAVFSPVHRAALLKGLETVDSFTINPHKILGVPLQCSLLLVNSHRELGRDALWRANGLRADYLFHDAPPTISPAVDIPIREGEEDNGYMMGLGDATIGCGRRTDSIKLYLSWKYHGSLGYQRRVENAFNRIQSLSKKLQTNPYFHLVLPYSDDAHATLSCSFWCIPETLLSQHGPIQELLEKDRDFANKILKNVTLAVHTELTRRGKFMIDYMGLPSQNLAPFVRVCISSSEIGELFLEDLVVELESIIKRCRVSGADAFISVNEE
ncbi:UNVERIFIED_CONTAM: hypothetical protein HDU68_010398 [Siphonaria sp. JEL0065]|nr:hypothetical protein HDU68_010398 [Siphonaria sp. JEL0065]